MLACAEVDEGEDDDRGLAIGGVGGWLAEALGEHGEDAGGALFFGHGLFAIATAGQGGKGVEGHEAGVELHGAHDGAEALADVDSGGEAGGGLFFEAAEDDAFELDGDGGVDLTDVCGIGELDGADGLELGGVRAVERVAAGGELVEYEAEGEDVGLDGGASGDELFRGHVGDGAAASGVGATAGGSLVAADAGVWLGVVGCETASETEVEDLDQAAVGEHDVGGFEIAMEDAE